MNKHVCKAEMQDTLYQTIPFNVKPSNADAGTCRADASPFLLAVTP